MLETLALVSIALPLLPVLKKNIFSLFVIVLLTTEFYYIEIGGGVARVYHFYAVLVVVMLAKFVPRLLSSRIFIALLLFVGANLCAILFSDDPGRAFVSFLSLAANIGVAMAVALILLSDKISLSILVRIILIVTIISIIWGIIQIVAFLIGGVNLALSVEQSAQILQGFGPGFRTEANTFGKYMIFPFLLLFPEYIEPKRIRKIGLVYLVFLVGILMNFTRSSIYGMGIAFLIIVFWYAYRRKFSVFAAKSFKIAVFVGICVFLITGGVIHTSDYAAHKVNKFFDQEEIVEGGSSAYRLKMMELIINDALEDSKKMLIGNGWGQTHYFLGRKYGSREVTAGGGDVVTVLGYSGVIGVLAYLFYMTMSAHSVWKVASSSRNAEKRVFSEGLLFAFAGVFCTSQMAGFIITPEYWLMIGLSIFLSLDQNLKQTHLRKI